MIMASIIDDKIFMEEIRMYPVIWNKFCPDFKNKHAFEG